MPGYFIYSVSMVKIIEGERYIFSDGLSGVGTEFLVCGGVG